MIAPDATCSHDKSHTGSVVAYERGDLDLRVAALRRAERPVADGAGAVSEVSSVRVQPRLASTGHRCPMIPLLPQRSGAVAAQATSQTAPMM